MTAAVIAQSSAKPAERTVLTDPPESGEAAIVARIDGANYLEHNQRFAATRTVAVALSVLLPLLLLLMLQSSPPTCPDVASCRAQAEAAAARGDYETFHDLAWRTVQKGRPNDPSLMFLLARAQSLSGRPDDALVMLGRIADLHVPVDLSLPDFDRARRLPGWAAVEARFAALPPAARPGAPGRPSTPADTGPPGTAAAAPPAAAAAPKEATEPLAFEAPANLQPFGLAHDAVSRRFVLGDAASRRLFIVDEVSKHVVTYVSAASEGLYDDLTALSVDARRGDLWVASVKGAGGDATSVVHKLQLVSGRTLIEARAPASLDPVRFVALAVTADGTVYALDAAGPRLFRLRAGARTFELVRSLDAPNPTAIAAADDRTLFVASDRGLLRVDAVSHAVQRVKSVEDLSGLTSIAWRNGALVGVQHASGASLVVRIGLDPSGARAQPRAILAASASPIVGTLAGGTFYYLLNGAIHSVAVR